jgi:predicted DNA-binding transcriptional regulator YafY
VQPPEPSQVEEEYLGVVEDAASQSVPLSMRYYTASRGTMSNRHASVHRVLPGPASRFIATCHISSTLKWFRIENIVVAHLDNNVKHRAATRAEVDAFVRSSVGGFNAGGAPATLTFTVREPESRWVANNLLSPMQAQVLASGGIRVTVETNALKQVARYVVGLGAAARPETPVLARAVEELHLRSFMFKQAGTVAHPRAEGRGWDAGLVVRRVASPESNTSAGTPYGCASADRSPQRVAHE